ncbi:hypothetical protein QUB33_09850 [Microcoleus sp. B3-A4]|uniref:hypothetical protein n=1 Tax=Microcoleus sp. B3-A4 TaxID=2818653 RepID=UPI002FCFE10C
MTQIKSRSILHPCPGNGVANVETHLVARARARRHHPELLHECDRLQYNSLEPN